MSGAALHHQLVRDYLAQLDAAMRGLPTAMARELREQITAHLDDALPPEASAKNVADAIARLGSPADLAKDAFAASGTADADVDVGVVFAARARRAWATIIGARLRTKVRACLILVVVVLAATYLTALLSAPLVRFGGVSVWWYRQDSEHAVETTANGQQQTTVPVRSGQRQGFAITVYNPSDFTETIVGTPGEPDQPWESPDGLFSPVQIAMSVPNKWIDIGGFVTDVGFTLLPGSIPPHQARLLRFTWISTVCLQGVGSDEDLLAVTLRVRVGWFTRTDVIPLPMGFALAGPSSPVDTNPGPNQNKCP